MKHLAKFKIKQFLYLFITSVVWASLYYLGINGFLAFCLAFLVGQFCVSFLIWPTVWSRSDPPTKGSLQSFKNSVYLSMLVALIAATLLFVVFYVM